MTSIVPKHCIKKKNNPLFKNIIIDEQHDFMSDRSTTTIFLVFQHHILMH